LDSDIETNIVVPTSTSSVSVPSIKSGRSVPHVHVVQRLISVRLATSNRTGRLVRFAVVGLSGLILNLLVLRLLLGLPIAWHIGLRDPVAEVGATQIAICWNFLLTEWWVFRYRTHRGSTRRRCAVFWASSCAALVAQLPLAAAMRALSGASYLVATAVSLVVLMLMRFVVYDSVLYSARMPPWRHRSGVQPEPPRTAEKGAEAA
jgi:dolichol-phosphate mannosyltransferase